MRRVRCLVARALLSSLMMGLLVLTGPLSVVHTAAPLPAASHWTEIMSWSFEAAGLPDPWHLYGNPTWGTAPGRSFGGDGSLWCARSGSAGRTPSAGYANNMNAWITYGPFDLGDAIAAQWSFHYWLDGKDSGDVLRWGASADGVNYRYWAADAITGQTSGWREELFDLGNVFDLGNLCGRSQVWVAIWFVSDGSGTAEGAYVDEMRIRKQVPDVSARCVLPLVVRSLRVSEALASAVVRGSQEGMIWHPSGATLYVPQGAVPPTGTGAEGEMLFTIEAGSPTDLGVSTEMPEPGMMPLGRVYYMTPEGFTLVKPVRVTLPLPPETDLGGAQVTILEWDASSSRWLNRGGIITPAGDGIYADLLHLSTLWLVDDPDQAMGKGALTFWRQADRSFSICISAFALKYPQKDGVLFFPQNYAMRLRRHDNDPAWIGDEQWLLPQGVYTLQIEVWEKAAAGALEPEVSRGYFTRQAEINRPVQWSTTAGTYDRGSTTPVDLTGYSLTSGRPSCAGTPTASVGIGVLNVRLEWNAACDLDLWVVDPCGNRIFWGTPSQSCGTGLGSLDLDNRCANLVLGRPENIYWQGTPPPGQYRVYVDPYENCGAGPQVTYALRTWIRGQATTARGTVNLPAAANQQGDQVLVKTFQY